MAQEQQTFNLSALKPIEIAENEKIKTSFVNTLIKMHRVDEATAESIYEREALYYKKSLLASQKLTECTNLSLYSSFLEIAVTGLSIQPGAKSEAYLEARSVNTGTKNSPVWGKACSLCVTAYGELNLRIKAGQIIRMNNPIVLYDGDHFQPLTNNRGELYVDYKPNIYNRSNKIIGCWVCIVLPHNGLDFKWLLLDDIERLKKYSERGMGGNANALYSSNSNQIDVGFLEAKTIKHAMRSYTKLKVSDAIKFEDEQEFDDENKSDFTPDTDPVESYNQAEAITVTDKEDIF